MSFHRVRMGGALRRTAATLALLGASGACTSDPAQKPPATAAVPATLAAQHPGDRGLGQDPAVVFFDDFQAGTVDAVAARYSEVKNKSAMTVVADHPPGSASGYSVQMNAGPGNANAQTYLFKSFGTGSEELYIRFYVKWMAAGPWGHSGVYMGGSNPPVEYPFPHAGTRPTGEDFFWLSLEPVGQGLNAPLDLYVSWMGMRSWKAANPGPRDFFGNTLIHKEDFRVRSDKWTCYELHLKLNSDPASAAGAVLEVWENDAQVQRFDGQGPQGYLVRDKFCRWDADDQFCTTYRPAKPVPAPLNQRWRSTPALGIDYIWMENYNNAPAASSMRFAGVVVAKRRIGCIASG
jgi:hypothetical protein